MVLIGKLSLALFHTRVWNSWDFPFFLKLLRYSHGDRLSKPCPYPYKNVCLFLFTFFRQIFFQEFVLVWSIPSRFFDRFYQYGLLDCSWISFAFFIPKIVTNGSLSIKFALIQILFQDSMGKCNKCVKLLNFASLYSWWGKNFGLLEIY